MATKSLKASSIKVGVVGYGPSFGMGGAHLREMQKAGMTPVAVCDVDAGRREAAQKDFPGIQAFANLKDMLAKSDVNLVTIITPHNTHAKLALQCLNAGRHVIVEKPMAITTAECDQMIAAAKKNKVILSTYHNRHWDGCILKAVELVRSGAIGQVIRVDAHMAGYGKPRDWWRSSKSISGGILYDWGVHLLEYTLQIMNADIVEVSGFSKRGYWASQTAWKNDTNEDEAFAVIRYGNGSWSTLMISSIDSNPIPSWLNITGTVGTLAFTGGSLELTTHGNGQVLLTKMPAPPSEGWRFYQNIADHLVKGKKLVITPEWARRPIHILDLACQSAQKGMALRAEYK